MSWVDFHAHILPGADHGSSSVRVTREQLNFALHHGVDRIVATPHFYPHKDSVEKFISRRNRCFEDMCTHITDDCPDIVLGAEVLMCNNINMLPGLEELCIGKSRVLLIELPFNDFSSNYVETAEQLIHDGYSIVLAHADRYSPENIERMLSCGAKIQLNADSLAKFFAKKHLYNWMERGKVVAIGSDIHGEDSKAYRNFSKAYRKIGKYAYEIEKASNDLWNSFTE